MTIYTPIESPHRVDKKYAVFKNIWSDFPPKKTLKTALKYVFLNGVSNNRFYDIKVVLNDRLTLNKLLIIIPLFVIFKMSY